MNTALTVRSNSGVQVETPDVMSLADAFMRSGYFKDVGQQAQAIVKILYGQEIGIGPVSAMMNIHVIEGKPAISSNLMAALIKRSGRYNYRVLRSESDGCELEFSDNGEILGKVAFTKADAQAAGCLNKQNWQKYPKAMYFARALSQGARMYCADVFLGAVYESESEELGPAPVVEEAAQENAPQEPVQASREQINEILNLCGTEEGRLSRLVDFYHVKGLSDLTDQQAQHAIRTLRKQRNTEEVKA